MYFILEASEQYEYLSDCNPTESPGVTHEISWFVFGTNFPWKVSVLFYPLSSCSISSGVVEEWYLGALRLQDEIGQVTYVIISDGRFISSAIQIRKIYIDR